MSWKNAVDFYGDGYYETGTDFEVKFGTGRFVRLDPTSDTNADLPDATSIPNWAVGGPVWTIQNVSGSNDVAIRDGDGTTVATLTGGPTGSEYDIVTVYLADNSTVAGTWIFKTGVAGSAPAPGVDEKIFWLAGLTATGLDRDKVDIYDIEDDSWSSGSDAPVNIAHAGTSVINDQAYVHGGPFQTNDDNSRYDAGFDSWVTLTSMPSNTAGDQVRFAAPMSGDSYLFGVATSGGIPEDVLEYDVTGDSWSTKTNHPERNDDCCGISYVAGGKIFSYGVNENLKRDQVYSFAPSTNSWTRQQNMAFPGRVSGGVVDNESNDTSYVARGFDDVLSATDAVFWHDMALDSYSSKGDHPETGQGDQGHARASGRIFHGGGGSDVKWWEYVPALDSWSQRTDQPRNKDGSWDQCTGLNTS